MYKANEEHLTGPWGEKLVESKTSLNKILINPSKMGKTTKCADFSTIYCLDMISCIIPEFWSNMFWWSKKSKDCWMIFSQWSWRPGTDSSKQLWANMPWYPPIIPLYNCNTTQIPIGVPRNEQVYTVLQKENIKMEKNGEMKRVWIAGVCSLNETLW